VTHRDANDWNAFALLEKLDPSMRQESANLVAGRLSKLLQSKKTAPKEKLQLAMKLAKTAEGALNLTNLIRRGVLSKAVLDTVIPLLEENSDPAVKAQLGRALARAPDAAASNAALVKEVAQLKGDPARGRELFFGAAVCATCHQFKGEGREIGPDMTKIREKFDRTGLVDSLVNPSSAVLVGYEATLIETKGGAVYLGFVEADGAIVVLRDLAGQRQRIDKAEIVKREVQENSVMPPVVGILKPAQIADVVAFLRDN
jgi:putative heme-binding domain-containing protein